MESSVSVACNDIERTATYSDVPRYTDCTISTNRPNSLGTAILLDVQDNVRYENKLRSLGTA